jgi:hypothetical protein
MVSTWLHVPGPESKGGDVVMVVYEFKFQR